jgi:hypothetical protein
MARKRKKLQGLDYGSPEYWNRLLNLEGLSVNQGKSEKLLYIGNSAEVARLRGMMDTNTGRVMPHRTDEDDDRE